MKRLIFQTTLELFSVKPMGRKKALIAILALATVGAIWLYSTNSTATRGEGLLSRLAFWQEQAGEEGVTVYGHIEIRTARLAFREQGRIREISVDEGDRVKKGQLLGQLDETRLLLQLRGAEAESAAQAQAVKELESGLRPQEIAMARAKVVAGKAQIHRVKLLTKRLRGIVKEGGGSKQQLDDAIAELAVSRALTELARQAYDLAKEGPRTEKILQARNIYKGKRAQVDFINQQLRDSQLRAPRAGIIQSRIAEPGEMAAMNVPALILSLTDEKWVRAYLPEPELGFVNLGMAASVFSDSFPDRPFPGKVGFISPQAEFTPKNVQTTDLRTQLVYEVRIRLDDSRDQLRLGMPVTVKIDRQ
ncbi:efflux RND transporter periplasmic adaptor subunit [Desulfotalea psychrophila]|uniref:CusB-like beta-barrel domain-containing protein n=1 Tax=Desulfotalea psychrophila (strain LSv54 / DSM 12343) TaxID=177439 RepID=Q6AN00_DESPS|nr:efflux RND transporter periplasmic adaptor subunit [Desulfotalea psychrophila]CAG36274.1 conserved hypothetical protein [Desulfotalea psychrophila LSv54]